MIGDTHFQRYIPDPHPESLVAPQDVRRHILCSGMRIRPLGLQKSKAHVSSTGQVYNTLLQEREDKGINDVAISRLEQISPFPYDLVCYPQILCYLFSNSDMQVTPHLDKYPNATLIWCQVCSARAL
jgi:2-oxoglutarate dehydrogenase E1 component